MIDLADKRVLVTGGHGFLGRHVVKALEGRGCRQIAAPRKAQYDLTHERDVEQMYADARPQIVVHLAAVVGGIGANRASPGRFFYENVMMGAMALEHARRAGVEKFVGVGTICAYPKLAPVPFLERDLWNGYPEETNAPYGIAKFLYVEDCAEAIVLATERYDKPEPVNIGVRFEISIHDLAELVAKLTGFSGRLVFDRMKPDGQPRRSLDVTRARHAFGFEATTDFHEGLRRTIAWYRTCTFASSTARIGPIRPRPVSS